MDADDIPPVPFWRLAHGDGWSSEWMHAHREMAPWRRVPDPHLIDELLRRPDRRALRNHYAWLASTTSLTGGTQQEDGGTRWERALHDPATMKTATVRVVLGTDETTIVTAFPSTPWRFSPRRT